MQKSELVLVRKLLDIYRSHSEEDVEAAINLIRSGRAFESFGELVGEVQRQRHSLPRSTRVRKSTKPKPSARDRLNKHIADLEDSGSDTHRAIADMLAAARDGLVLKSSSAILQLLVPLGPEPSRNADRLSLLRLLGESLADLPADRLRPILEAALQTAEGNSSLDRWTNIIVRRRAGEE